MAVPFGFNTETSPGPAIPSLASREKFLPDPNAWPPTSTWSLHNGGGEFVNLKVFDEAMDAVYAKPLSAADYERMAQTMEYDSERAMFEAYSKNKYVSTGVIQWMLNNAWPSMIWHLYDYYLDAGAGYFAAEEGLRAAAHPVFLRRSVDCRSQQHLSVAAGLRANVHVHNLAWKELYSVDSTVDAGVDSAQRIFQIPDTLYSGADEFSLLTCRLQTPQARLSAAIFIGWPPR